MNIIHRDIKPDNILIKNGIIKISDFGFSRYAIFEGQENFTNGIGTPLYMSPQLLNNSKYTSKCDVWSVGVVLYQMLYGDVKYYFLKLIFYFINLIKNLRTNKFSFENFLIKRLLGQEVM